MVSLWHKIMRKYDTPSLNTQGDIYPEIARDLS